ncbi:MAG: superinfection immunity protein [Trinickia sp.]|jgi:hypothetical protein|uniref:superinfection immunity protein n=1 Tax=Trinickia sp. TaxID=2571163 RepID=UPI002F4114BD
MLDEIIEGIEVFAALALYFLPAITADRRRRRDVLTIALFNACLGWTGFGWLIALYWATLPNPPPGVEHEVVRKRRMHTMVAFSQALAARVARREARDRTAEDR